MHISLDTGHLEFTKIPCCWIGAIHSTNYWIALISQMHLYFSLLNFIKYCMQTLILYTKYCIYSYFYELLFSMPINKEGKLWLKDLSYFIVSILKLLSSSSPFNCSQTCLPPLSPLPIFKNSAEDTIFPHIFYTRTKLWIFIGNINTI